MLTLIVSKSSGNKPKRKKSKCSVRGKNKKKLTVSSHQASGNKESGDSSQNWNMMMKEFKKTISEGQSSLSFLENKRDTVRF